MRCQHCNTPLVDGKLRCVNPKCRMWNAAAKTGIDESTVLLSDAKLLQVERVKTNLVDTVYGGGIARTGVSLLGGDPGAGKTTLCLQLSNLFAEQYGREVLYIANEQHAPELKETAQRLQLEHLGLIRVVKAMGGIAHDIGTILLHYKPCLTILDSVTKWTGEDVREAVIICQRLKDYTVRLNAPTIVVNQVTKSGDHSGLNAMQHAVDTTLLFEVMGDAEKPDEPRRLRTRKNRHGPAPVSQYYEMTGIGLMELTEETAFKRLYEQTGKETFVTETEDAEEDENDENE